jgi:hypothetical protein
MGGPTQGARFAAAFANDYAAGNYAAALDNATKAVQASVTRRGDAVRSGRCRMRR